MEVKYKAMYKSELAREAGVTLRVLNNWLKNDGIDIPKYCRLLPPNVVKFLCEKYVIILEN